MFSTTALIENLLTSDEQVILAEAILKAQEIQEESWDNKEGRYMLSNESSAIKACEIYNLQDFYVEVVFWLNFKFWNDIQAWSEFTIKKYEE